MKRVVWTMFVSLDGVVENPAWSMPYWNDGIAAFKQEEQDMCDTLLLGRVTYEGFAAAWPGRTDDGADWMNGTPKLVATTTLREAAWSNSSIIREDVQQAVRALKQQAGKDILIYGSATLARALMVRDLIDEYRMLVYPVVVGAGSRMFEGVNAQANLRLARSQTFSSGAVGLIYVPDRA
ncbi:MAG: dihydrofolate reductase family protein [Anaerolineae bacterium]|nr:dihydrofolate reductase family protein [Anaerolineae bacterium]